MKYYLTWLKTKWNKEEIATWRSMVRVLYVLLPIVFYSLLQDLIEILLWALVNYGADMAGDQVIAYLSEHSDTLKGILYAVTVILALLPFKTMIRNEISSVMNGEKLTDFSVIQKYLWIAILGLGAAFSLNFGMGLLSAGSNSAGYQQVADAQYGVSFFIGLFLYGVVSPITEEIIYRGITYQRLKRTFGVIPAMLISALIFGGLHGNWEQAVYGTLMGILLAWVYEKYAGFLAPVLVHMVANLGVYSITYGNRLAGLSRKTCIIATIVSVLITGVCFWYMNWKMPKSAGMMHNGNKIRNGRNHE